MKSSDNIERAAFALADLAFATGTYWNEILADIRGNSISETDAQLIEAFLSEPH